MGRHSAFTSEDVVIDEPNVIQFLTSPGGPVGRFISELMIEVAFEAKARAPVGDRDSILGWPAGHLRDEISWETEYDTEGVHGYVSSPAMTSAYNPHPDEPYGLYLEEPSLRPYDVPDWIKDKEGAYLRPALHAVIDRYR